MAAFFALGTTASAFGTGDAAVPTPAPASAAPGQAVNPLDLVAAIAAGAAQCAAARLTGTRIYYACDCDAGGPADTQPVSCSPGDDRNDGTSPSSPFRSWAKVVSTFSSMPAGATVALCRGGAWNTNGTNFTRNYNCYDATRTTFCTMRDYTPPGGSPSLPRPALVNTARRDAWGPFTFFTKSPRTHGNYRFHNLTLRSTNPSQHGWFWFYDDARNVDLCNDVIWGGGSLMTVTIDSRYCTGGSDCNKGASFRYNYLKDMASNGMLGQGTDWDVSYNDFDHCGGTSNREHAIYAGSNQGHTVKNMRIVGNRFRRSVDNGSGACTGSVIIVHGSYENLRVEGNDIEETSTPVNQCWGISVNSNREENSRTLFLNPVIRGNRIRGVGNVGIHLANARNAVVENNLLAWSSPPFSVEGIVASTEWGSAQQGDALNEGIVVRNNTIVYAGGKGFTPLILQSAGGASILGNNASWGGAGATTTCAIQAGAISAGGNSCAKNGSPPASALFRNPSGGDFSLARGSPLKDAGVSTPGHYAPADITGAPRALPPSQGAYE